MEVGEELIIYCVKQVDSCDEPPAFDPFLQRSLLIIVAIIRRIMMVMSQCYLSH